MIYRIKNLLDGYKSRIEMIKRRDSNFKYTLNVKYLKKREKDFKNEWSLWDIKRCKCVI